VGCVIVRVLRTGVAANSIVMGAAFFGRAAAQTDSQLADFLASVNRSITALPGQVAYRASLTCSQIVASAINMDAVTRSALGPMWDCISSRQRAAYRVAAQRWAVRGCLRQNQDNSGHPLEFLGVRQGEANERLLTTRSSQPSHTVIWRFHGSGRIQAVDVVIDGRSMILSLRDETKALLDRNHGDFDFVTEMLGR
jgi:ABC-type transporter MlaC component